MEDIASKNSNDSNDSNDSFEDSAPVQSLSGADEQYAFEFEDLGESLVFSNTLAPSSDRQVLVAENQNSAYIVAATDADGDALTYNLDGTDAALFSIDTNGVVTFNNAPDFENPGDADSDNVYRLTVAASDGLHSASQPLAIQVTNENDVSIPSSSSAIAEESNKGSIIINDNELQTPKAGFTLNVDLNQSTATPIGTTANSDDSADIVLPDAIGYLSFLSEGFIPYKSSGQQYVTLVSDTQENAIGFTDGETALSGVDANLIFAGIKNTALVFTSGTEVNVEENQTAAYTAVVTDADGDALTYSLDSGSTESDTTDSELTSKTSLDFDNNISISGTDAALFSIDANGVVTFNTAPDYEAPGDTDGDNIYELTIIVSDGVNSTRQDITVTVTNVNDNAPAFTSGTEVDAEENQTAAYTAVVTDADGDALTYSLDGTDAALFDIDANGVVTFNTAPDYEAPDDTDGDNIYELTVIASDGVNNTRQDITVTVTNVNDNNVNNNAPEFTSGTEVDAEENQTAAYTAVVTDADGDALTYSLDGTDAALFDIDANGVVTFDTAPDYEAPDDTDGDNIYELTVNASDGVNNTRQDITVTVTNANDAPAFTSGTEVDAEQGDTAAYTAVVTDADADALTYSLDGTDAALFDIDANGVVTFNTAPDYEAPDDTDGDNIYELTVIASDGVNNTRQDITITVTNTDIELSDVQGNDTSSFVINGINEGDLSGLNLSNAGDVNGDGFDDLIVGAPGTLGTNSTGASYLVFGAENLTNIELAAIADGNGGFVINGVSAGDRTGFSASSAGDVNGDGFDDLIIGTPDANTGASYLVFGAENLTNIELSAIADGDGGFVINRAISGDVAGVGVSGGGDINGDGLDDLIIGAPNFSDNNAIGTSYVVFGKTDSTVVELSALNATDGIVINGVSAGDNSGLSVSNAGDVNGDGLDDLIVGAWAINDEAGASYVVFGTTDGNASIELSELSLDQGFTINGASAGDRLGAWVSDAGDVNGDGFDDLLVGANGADNSTGSSYVIFGSSDTGNIELSELSLDQGFAIHGVEEGDRAGFVVSGAGDINGDGLDDLIIGAYAADNNTGETYLVFGKTDGASIELSDMELGIGGFVIHGLSEGDKAGKIVSGAGDLNGDGFDDLVVGAPETDSSTGASYVIFGGLGSSATVGTDGDDILNGDTDADQIVAGLGDDTLVGNGGADVLRGGAGDDILAISDANFASLDGGNGTDTLRFDAEIELDFTTLSDNLITDIEQIDLIENSVDSDITLDLTDVLNMSSTSNTLTIFGDSGDSVTLIETSNGQSGIWEDSSSNGVDTYNFVADATGSVLASVMIDENILVNVA